MQGAHTAPRLLLCLSGQLHPLVWLQPKPPADQKPLYTPMTVQGAQTLLVVGVQCVVSPCPTGQTLQSVQYRPSTENLPGAQASHTASEAAVHGVTSRCPAAHTVQLRHGSSSPPGDQVALVLLKALPVAVQT